MLCNSFLRVGQRNIKCRDSPLPRSSSNFKTKGLYGLQTTAQLLFEAGSLIDESTARPRTTGSAPVFGPSGQVRYETFGKKLGMFEEKLRVYLRIDRHRSLPVMDFETARFDKRIALILMHCFDINNFSMAIRKLINPHRFWSTTDGHALCPRWQTFLSYLRQITSQDGRILRHLSVGPLSRNALDDLTDRFSDPPNQFLSPHYIDLFFPFSASLCSFSLSFCFFQRNWMSRRSPYSWILL